MKKQTVVAQTAQAFTISQPQAIIVHSEMELNLAIENINKLSAESNVIDVQSGFTLTENTTVISQNMTLMSSNNSAITDGGFSVLSINNGAQVNLSMKAGGTGTVYVNGDGANSTLSGLTGGEVNTVFLENDGRLLVEEGQQFTTGHIDIEPISGASISGTLNNSLVMHINQGIVSNAQNTNAQMQDLDLFYQAFLKIASGTTFTVANLTAQSISSVNSDGTGTLKCKGKILLTGDVNSYTTQGQILGANVEGEVIMENGGTYSSSIDQNGTPGGNATAVTNNSGIFDLGHAGDWNVGTYTQTGGLLRVTLPDFTGSAPVLNIKNASITGGEIHINAGIYYLPSGTTSQNIKLISASGKLNISDLATMVKFQYFPDGITPSVQQKGNDIYLVLTVG